jgi:hypothetical protein
MTYCNHPPSFHDILSVSCRVFKHAPEINFCESPIDHALEKVRAQFQLPVPPYGPTTGSQNHRLARPSYHGPCTVGPLAQQ